MYFITPVSSETGKKFTSIRESWRQCLAAQKVVAAEFGFRQWRSEFGVVFGGISSVKFESEPDMNAWKKDGPDEYSPRLNTLMGRAIRYKFDALPKISIEELNSCVGFENPFCTIGYAFSKDGFVGIQTEDDWEIDIPSDCEEITATKYKQIFTTKP